SPGALGHGLQRLHGRRVAPGRRDAGVPSGALTESSAYLATGLLAERPRCVWGQTLRATGCTHLSRKRKKVSPFSDLQTEVGDVVTMHFSILFKGLIGP